MGEEEKKKVAEEKEMEEKKVEDVGKKGEEEEKPLATEKKKADEESIEDSPIPSPIIPQETVLQVYMHCEGCARKVRLCLKGFQGVEDVMTDCKSNKVVVKGEKADPLKVLDRLQRKSHRQVELLSPIPKPPPPAEDINKTEDTDKSKPEDKKEEHPAVVITVVLKVYMHCEACALAIKKRIQRMKGVESAEADLKSSEVRVKGVFEPPKLVEYVYKRTGKTAVIVEQEAEPETLNSEEEKAKDDSKDEKKSEESGDKNKKEASGEGEEDNNKDKKQEGDNKDANATATDAEPANEESKAAVELKKNEYYHYPPRYATEFYAYPPQIFSDENPNACSVM